MERIQSAIQKARLAREGRTEAPLDVRSPTKGAKEAARPQSETTEKTAATTAWERIEAFTPNRPHLERGRVVTLEPGSIATPFDVMRTRLLKQLNTNAWRRLAITSPGAGCGKTMTSLNLAFSLARQADIRTMVIEIDMRRPSMARALGIRPHHNFSEVLAGRADPHDHLVRYGSNLAFGTNEKPIRHSAELLQSTTIVKVLDRLQEIYMPDLLIFDMPPMLASDDAIAFLSRVDCALLVAAAGTTTVDQVDQCERDIAAHTNVIGVVLNKCRYLDRDQSYGYYDA